jgi:hypothetical protein
MKSNRSIALLAGISLLLMALAAGFSFGYVHSGLVVPGNPEFTHQNLTESTTLFRAGILGWLLVFLLDILVAWALYVFFKPVNERLSLLAGWLRLAYTIFLGAAIGNLVIALNSLSTQLPDELMLFLTSFESLWSVGLIVFGLHLLLLGYLALKMERLHWIFGILLIIGGIGYSLIHAAKFMLPEFGGQIAAVEMVMSVPMALAEIGFAIWLIVRGGR